MKIINISPNLNLDSETNELCTKKNVFRENFEKATLSSKYLSSSMKIYVAARFKEILAFYQYHLVLQTPDH